MQTPWHNMIRNRASFGRQYRNVHYRSTAQPVRRHTPQRISIPSGSRTASQSAPSDRRHGTNTTPLSPKRITTALHATHSVGDWHPSPTPTVARIEHGHGIPAARHIAQCSPPRPSLRTGEPSRRIQEHVRMHRARAPRYRSMKRGPTQSVALPKGEKLGGRRRARRRAGAGAGAR